MPHNPDDSAERETRRGAVTWRSVLVGLAGAVVVNAWPTYSGYVVRSTWADFGQIDAAVLLPYILFVGVFNAALRRVNRRLALSGPEVLVAFMMAAVAATMQGEGLAGYFLGVITAPHYFASPENGWADYILPHAPAWALVSNDGDALRYFYEGLPRGHGMAWHPFVVPILWWGTFFAGLYLLSCFVAVLLRKQWAEHERLPYPLAQVPMLLATRTGPGWLPDVARQRLFWYGAAVPLGIILWNMVSWFATSFPKLPLIEGFTVFPRVQFSPHFPPIHAKVDFFVMGFAFLTSTEVLFSLWFFHLLSVLQVGVMNRLGASIGPADDWCSWDAATGWQSLGGFAVFVGWGLWMARDHLAAVVRKARWGQGELDDRDELVSYRTAFYGAIVCFAYCVVWLGQVGMSWLVGATFLAVLLLGYVGIAKIAAMSGLIYLRGPVTAQAAVWYLFGTANLAPSTMVGLGLTYTFFTDAKGWLITPITHVAHLARTGPMAGQSRRGLFGWVGAASLVGAATAIVLVLHFGAQIGAYHFGAATFQWSHVLIWNTVAARVKASALDPTGTDWARLGFAGVGATFTGLLLWLRTRLAWWPLHPVGFTIASSYPIRDSAFTVFLLWLIKAAAFRFGGIGLYRRMAPFFVGILVGYVLGVGLGFLVDCLWFPGAGHPFHGF